MLKTKKTLYKHTFIHFLGAILAVKFFLKFQFLLKKFT